MLMQKSQGLTKQLLCSVLYLIVEPACDSCHERDCYVANAVSMHIMLLGDDQLKVFTLLVLEFRQL